MQYYKRTHPTTVLSKILILMKAILVPTIILILSTHKQDYFNYIATGTTLIYGLLLFLIFMGWYKTRYLITENTLEIEKGFLFHTKLSLPFDKIQAIQMTETFLSKIFPIIKMHIENAGNSSQSDIDFLLSVKEAERIQCSVYPELKKEEENKTYIRQVTQKELFILSITSKNAFIGLPILYGLYEQLEEFFPNIIVKVLKEFILLKDFVVLTDKTLGQMNTMEIFAFSLHILSFIFVVVLFSIIIVYIKYANFRLYRNEKNIIIEHGVFVMKKITIPINKIQAVIIHETIFQQPFGLASLEVESIGYAGEDSQKAILFPLIKKRETIPFIQELLPEIPMNLDEEGTVWDKPKRNSWSRYIIYNAMFYICICMVWIFFLSYSHFLLIGLLLFMIWGILQYRDAGLSIKEDTIRIRYREIDKKTIYITALQIQSIDVDQDLWGKRKGMATFEFYLASENSNRMFKLKHMDKRLEDKIFKWYWKQVNSKK